MIKKLENCNISLGILIFFFFNFIYVYLIRSLVRTRLIRYEMFNQNATNTVRFRTDFFVRRLKCNIRRSEKFPRARLTRIRMHDEKVASFKNF